MEKLVGTSREGDFVHQNQEMGAPEGFRNVSRLWLQKCRSYDAVCQELAEGQAQTEDLLVALQEMRPAVEEGQLVLKYQDRSFKPNPFSLSQMSRWARCGRYYPLSLYQPLEKDELGRATDDVLVCRDEEDAHMLARVFQNGFRRRDGEQPFLFRVRGGTLRAMLSAQYFRIDNMWLMETLRSLVPDGLCSHWRGDSDTVWGNVLIPDSLRQERDSDYGGMFSIGNSEIGERELEARPSLFRAICMNGCIWGATEGQTYRRRHRGTMLLQQIYEEIRDNLTRQIPLLEVGVQKLLSTQKLVASKSEMLPLFAAVAHRYHLTRPQATEVLKAYNVERAITAENARSLFGVINAVTRAGQLLSNQDWVRFDQIGGSLVSMTEDQWTALKAKANGLSLEDVESAFASIA